MNSQDFIKDLNVSGQTIRYFDIQQLTAKGIADIDRLPFSIRILVDGVDHAADAAAEVRAAQVFRRET